MVIIQWIIVDYVHNQADYKDCSVGELRKICGESMKLDKEKLKKDVIILDWI